MSPVLWGVGEHYPGVPHIPAYRLVVLLPWVGLLSLALRVSTTKACRDVAGDGLFTYSQRYEIAWLGGGYPR